MRKKYAKLFRICLVLGIFHIFASLAYGESSKPAVLYMLPYEQTQALSALKEALQHAKSEIKISIYNFTHSDIAKVLRDSAARGVKISIIYDKESNEHNKKSTIGYLAKYNNISVCLLSGIRAKKGGYYGIMHQKMAIIDEQILILGSANWTKNAFENSFETLLVTYDSALIDKALQAYEKMANTCARF